MFLPLSVALGLWATVLAEIDYMRPGDEPRLRSKSFSYPIVEYSVCPSFRITGRDSERDAAFPEWASDDAWGNLL